MQRIVKPFRPWQHAAVISRLRISFAILMTVLAVVYNGGCSGTSKGLPSLAPVSGTVTMDGEPLQKVLVTFLAEKGIVTSGVTDAVGRYTLLYRGIHRGAGMGRNTVQVTTMPDDPDRGLAKEPIPAVYNNKSILTADVVAGANTFDFKLESKTRGKKP
jgi:hypothetical protein